MLSYLVASTVVFWLLAATWSKSDVYNACIKVGFYIFAVLGTLISLQAAGYIVKG